jgi:phage I-like protein
VALPTELVIAPWGASRALDGTPVIVNERTAAVLSANQDEIGRAEIALDFEHNTFDGPDVTAADRHAKEPRKVAGYGALSVVPGKGIVYLPLADAWTPEGIEHVTGKHYRDLSPVPILDEETGEVIAMHSVALTRAGQIPTLRAYSATADLTRCLKALSADYSTDPANQDMKFRAIACAALGLPETATDEEIVAAGEKKPAATPNVIPMSAELDARLKAIEDGQVASQRQAIVTAAAAAGKIIPLSADAVNLLSPATLQTIVDGLTPGAVPMSSNTPSKDQGDKLGQPKALSAEEAEVAKRLGISEEDYRKANPEA